LLGKGGTVREKRKKLLEKIMALIMVKGYLELFEKREVITIMGALRIKLLEKG